MTGANCVICISPRFQWCRRALRPFCSEIFFAGIWTCRDAVLVVGILIPPQIPAEMFGPTILEDAFDYAFGVEWQGRYVPDVFREAADFSYIRMSIVGPIWVRAV